MYNDRNHRVKKESYHNENLLNSTFYVRDVAGQVMAIFTEDGSQPQLVEQPIYGAARIGVQYTHSLAVYELTDHLGNVRALFTKESATDSELEGYTDYYPFGMPMPWRKMQDADGYRYAFQGQEKDDETGKEAFELRLWDSRIGRWLTRDPAGQYASPYLGMGNNPISRVDPDGGFDTFFGALAYWVSHGFEGEIFNNNNGDWGISSATFDENNNLIGDLNIIYGWNWEKNNKNRIAFGGELGLNGSYSAIAIGNSWEGSLSYVNFMKFPENTSFYANSNFTVGMSTDVSATIGLSGYAFVSYYDGDVSKISPESYEGPFHSSSAALDVNLIGGSLGISGTYIYSPNSGDIGKGWHTIAIGIHGNLGPDVSVAGQPLIGGSMNTSLPNAGHSKLLGTIYNPFNASNALNHIYYE